MGSDAMIYILSSIKTDSGIQKLIGGIHIQTRTQTVTIWTDESTDFPSSAPHQWHASKVL
jgi:hypothetical protein